MRVFRAMWVVEEVEDPLTEFTLDEAKPLKADANVGDLVEIRGARRLHLRAHPRPDRQAGRPPAPARGRARGRLRPVRGPRERDHHRHREPGRAARRDPGRGQGGGHPRHHRPVRHRALPHRPARQGVRAGGPAHHPGAARSTSAAPTRTSCAGCSSSEVPEIHAGTVEIKAIAREAGSRSKVAVASRQEGLDPVGATVGQRGGRVQSVVAELGGEKIDVIPWSDDPAVFVANALSPAQVVSVDIDEEGRIANVTVPERMLSLAIGREGQNARLAAKLTGWRIDIRSDQAPPRRPMPAPPAAAAPRCPTEPPTRTLPPRPAPKPPRPTPRRSPRRAADRARRTDRQPRSAQGRSGQGRRADAEARQPPRARRARTPPRSGAAGNQDRRRAAPTGRRPACRSRRPKPRRHADRAPAPPRPPNRRASRAKASTGEVAS